MSEKHKYTKKIKTRAKVGPSRPAGSSTSPRRADGPPNKKNLKGNLSEKKVLPVAAGAPKKGGEKVQSAQLPQDRVSTRTAPRVNKKSVRTAPSLAMTPKRRKLGTEDDNHEEIEKVVKSIARSSTTNQNAGKLRTLHVHSVYPSGESDEEDDDNYPTQQVVDVSMLGIGSRVFPPNLDFELETEESSDLEDPSSSIFADDPSVEMRIREIEDRLDGLRATIPLEELDRESTVIERVPAAAGASAIDSAREVLQSDYYQRQWGRTSLRQQATEIDEFGQDKDFEQKLRPVLEFLFKKYFRVEVEGIENIPASGRAVIVANHSGALPFDGVMLREAIRLNHPKRDDLRWLAEDFSFYLPFLGVTLNRIGAVRACPENAERLLAKEHLIGVFPEGAEGIKKLYKNRYQLQRFGRGGFVRLCLSTRSPIIPCAIVGAEETNPIVYRFDNLSKLLGLDYLPITPTFPFLGPLGLLPAPTKWKIVFGEAISFDQYGPQAARDHVLVGRLAERIRLNISELLEAALRKRKSIWR